MTRLTSFKDLESELLKLYEYESEACRASLFNVVVYCPSPQREEYLKEFSSKIIDRFPCRLIFITELPDPNSFMTVDVAVKNHAQVSCDYIEIQIGTHEAFKLPYLILPHLLTDLPLFLMWGDDPLKENDLYKILAPYASKIIFDTLNIKNLTQFAGQFLQHPNKKLRDVNWTLISDWRELTCRVIDTEDKRMAVSKAERVKIIYQKESSVQARFLKGWLIKHFGISPTIFNLMQQECQAHDGDIFSLEILCPGDQLFACYRRGFQALVHISTKETCELPVTYPLTKTKRGFTFWRELLFEGLSSDYLSLLEFLKDE